MTAALLIASCGNAGTADGQRVVDYAKGVDVATLDPALRSQGLADWLRAVLPRGSSAQWRAASCSNSSRPDDNLCVRVDLQGDGASATALLRVGTRRDGISGKPRLQVLEVPPYATNARMSELPRLISQGAAAVRHARTLDVRALDATLASRPLEEWLRRGPSRIQKLDWRVSDCDIKPIDEDRDRYPLCVAFLFQRGAVSGQGIILVGTLGSGVTHTARLEHAVVSTGEGPAARRKATRTLSELPVLMARADADRR